MQAAKPANVDVRVLKGLWTEESAYNAVGSWLKLNVAKDVAFGLVAGQNDAMALGARRAFQELTGGAERDRWLSLPYIGCDGLRNTGQAYVHRGLLAATIVIPANAGQAIKALVTSLRTGQQPSECIFTSASSFRRSRHLSPSPSTLSLPLAPRSLSRARSARPKYRPRCGTAVDADLTAMRLRRGVRLRP